jgi:Nuclease-related domain
MAWPKLRTPKSRGQLETQSDHSGTAPNGARPHGAASDRAASSPAGGAPAGSGPAGSGPAGSGPAGSGPVEWAGGEVAPDESPADAPEGATDTGDVPFWDWAGTNAPAEPDDPADAFSRGDARTRGGAAGADPPRSAPRLVITPVEVVSDRPRPTGIGQRRGDLAHLSANPRMRMWQRRIVIAIIVGVLFSILFSWRLGLTLAIIAAITDTVYQSRRGVPGPRVKMTRAQRHTRRQLAKLRRAGYRAINGNLIPHSKEQIDHLVVGPAGVFAIDSEAWDRRLQVRTKNARQLWHGPNSMTDRLEHARWESEQAAELLSAALGSPVTVRPAMAVYGPQIRWDVVTIRDVDVFSGPRLRKYLRRRAKQNGVRTLPAAEVERIYQAANRAFPHLNTGATAA